MDAATRRKGTGAKQRLYFDTVDIIEWLRPGDCQTGQRLFDELRPLGKASMPEVTVRYTSVKNRIQFLTALRAIAADARLLGHSVVLHLETHGCPEGIGLGMGEFLRWEEFKDELTAINEAGRLNLLVILAACNGAHLLNVIQPTDRAPVHAIIGPNRKVGDDEILKATLAFYRTLFAESDGVAAWRVMNAAVAPAPRTFDVFTAEFTLRYVMSGYLKKMCTDAMLTQREDQAVRKAQEDGLSGASLDHFRAWFRLYARDHKSHFERIKRHFFFCDLYPENESRFRVSFEDCENFDANHVGRNSENRE